MWIGASDAITVFYFLRFLPVLYAATILKQAGVDVAIEDFPARKKTSQILRISFAKTILRLMYFTRFFFARKPIYCQELYSSGPSGIQVHFFPGRKAPILRKCF